MLSSAGKRDAKVQLAEARDTSQLDGIRLLAFLTVFLFHNQNSQDPTWLTWLESRGWVGVDIFFSLSTFLLFTLFIREFRSTGTFSLSKFYIRRIIRIYPLMISYCVLMIFIYGPQNDLVIPWILSIIAGICNISTIIPNMSLSISDTQHFWTLGFELQVYLFLPFSFLIYAAFSRRALMMGLASLALIALMSRLVLGFGGAPPAALYLIPQFRPEPSVAGLIIAMGISRGLPDIAAWIGLLAGAALLFALPNVDTASGAMVLNYASALVAASLLHIAIYSRTLAVVLTLAPIAYLGRISFGLYIFHIWGARLAGELGTSLSIQPDRPVQMLTGFAITTALATLSYWGFERPINNLKPRSGARVATTTSTKSPDRP